MGNGPPKSRRNGVSPPKGGFTHNARLIVPADIQAIVRGLPETDPRRALLIRDDGAPKGALIKTTRRRNAEEAHAVGEAMIREWKEVGEAEDRYERAVKRRAEVAREIDNLIQQVRTGDWLSGPECSTVRLSVKVQ